MIHRESALLTGNRLIVLLYAALAALPAVILAVLIFHHSVNVPHSDGLISYGNLLYKQVNNDLSAADLFAQHNESRPLFPRIFFLAIANLTQWDVRYQMMFTFFLACLISCNIYFLIPHSLPGLKQISLLLMIPVNILVFSPIQSDNWLKGFQSLLFFPPVCLTAALVICRSTFSTVWKIVFAAAVSFIATFSFANGILCWILLIPILLPELIGREGRRKQLLIVYLVCAVATAVLYFRSYQQLVQHQGIMQVISDPFSAVVYLLQFLGAPLGYFGNVKADLGAGIFLGVFFILCLGYMLIQRNKKQLWHRTMPWVSLAGYAVLSGVIITYGRLGRSIEPAPRYTSISVYFSIALFILFVLIIHDIKDNFPKYYKKVVLLSVPIASVLIFLSICAGVQGVKRMDEIRIKRLSERACLAFINVLPESGEFKGHQLITGYRQFLGPMIKQLNQTGRWKLPYIQGPDIQKIDGQKRDATTRCGKLVNFEQTSIPGIHEAEGYAYLKDRREPADAILFTYRAQNNSFILFDYIFGPFKPVTIENGKCSAGSWHGTVLLKLVHQEDADVSAWAYDALSGRAYKLEGSIRINRSQEGTG